MEMEKEYFGMPANTYCMTLHLSQLLNFVAPSLGLILPVLMWLLNKDKNEKINNEGKATINWTLSLVVYSIIPFMLMLTGVEVLLYIAIIIWGILFLSYIVFAIIAAVKTNENRLWAYPFSIRFIK